MTNGKIEKLFQFVCKTLGSGHRPVCPLIPASSCKKPPLLPTLSFTPTCISPHPLTRPLFFYIEDRATPSGGRHYLHGARASLLLWGTVGRYFTLLCWKSESLVFTCYILGPFPTWGTQASHRNLYSGTRFWYRSVTVEPDINRLLDYPIYQTSNAG